MLPPKTPGVYIVEQNAFPDSVVEVATAIPVFIGYTQQASYKGKSLAKIPTKVESLKQFEDFFGAGFQQIFNLVSTAPAAGTGSISGGSITGATLNGGNLAGGTPPASGASVITGATVADAEATALDITRATITGGSIKGGTINAATVTGATITGNNVSGTLADGDVKSGTLTAGGITNGTLTAGTITGGTFTGTFTGGTVTGTTLTGATISADINSANITAASLTGATATGVTINATDVDISSADVSKADTVDTTITKTGSSGGNFTSGLIGNGATIKGGSLALPPPSSSSPADLTFAPAQAFQLAPQGPTFYLYNAIQLFYLNGGSTCYIVSIGTYPTTAATAAAPSPKDFTGAIDLLEAEQDPTMLLCPDALMLDNADYYNVLQHMLAHCDTVKKRVALFDVYGDNGSGKGTASLPPGPDDTDNFRSSVGTDTLNYGIAYYPWVNASVVSVTDVSFLNLTPNALNTLAGLPTTAAAIKTRFADAVGKLSSAPAGSSVLDSTGLAIHNSLLAGSPEYGLTLRAITNHLNVQPVAPAMAGVITRVDNARGVWKAPANVSLNAVISPNVLVSDLDQENLNVDALTGKSINVIRAFKGLGTLVWGARTLDGNSQDWRYINVRRTMIMIEQSIKLAARNTVFEPNDANTWTTFKSMLNSFLFNLWKQGALFGTKPDDAYQVLVGLGTTMTTDDVLDGIMNVTVLVALVRPAEFIVVTFKQQMQQAA